MSGVVNAASADVRYTSLLLTVLAVVTVTLAGVGTFSVLAHAVSA